MSPLVEVLDVSRTFTEGGRERQVLRGASCRVPAGERVALLGRSGSGKSTLLHLIAGIDTPDAGSVRVAGHDLAALGDRERTRFRRRHIGLVFQFFHLIPILTVAENVSLPLELGGRPDGARDRADELLAQVGLGDRAASYPDRLSGGEQQRVAIARALVCDPELILADEPTGNLDEHNAEAVLDLLDELARTAGKTVILATHSRRAAGRCERVLTLADGALREAAAEPSAG